MKTSTKTKKSKLPAKVQRAVDEYIEELLKKYSQEIERIMLFGSYARGEQWTESDVDLLIETNLPEKKSRMRTRFWIDAVYLADDIDYKYDYEVGISPRIVTNTYAARWTPLMANVRREGVTLWEKTK